MTAFKRATPASYGAERPIIASAQRIDIRSQTESDKIRQRASVTQVWQEEAWTYFDNIGEIKFAYNLVASIASRLRLYVGAIVDPDAPPVAIADAIVQPGDEDNDSTADDASDARVDRALDPERAKEADYEWRRQMRNSKVSQIIRTLVLNLEVPGESYLVLNNNRWVARSTSEIKVGTDNRYQVRRSVADSGSMTFLPKDATVGRIWREHPKHSLDPDSALLGMRSDCEELLLLSRMVRAVTRSRLNAGVVFMSDELSLAAKATEDGTEEGEEEGDSLEIAISDAVADAINSENSGSTAIPVFIRGPKEAGAAIQHITFERKSDEFLIARADRVLERILAGLDVPKDVVTGLANVKYSNAVQIDENLYKAHVEPLALMMVDAFTEIILHPVLRERGWTDDELAQVCVWYDPSEIVVRPNRSEDAQRGYDSYLLSGAAWRDAHGFGDTDAPDEDEIAFRLAIEKAVVPPELATVLFNRLLPKTTRAARMGATSDGSVPKELQDMLDGEVPDSPAPASSADPNADPAADTGQDAPPDEGDAAPTEGDPGMVDSTDQTDMQEPQ